MRIEAFSQGKVFLRPEDNEDSFIAIPGIGYAVIDGVTDHNGTFFGEMRAGRFAAQVVKRALGEFLLTRYGPDSAASDASPMTLVGSVSEKLRAAYDRFGQLDDVRRDLNRRAGCAFTVAAHAGKDIEIIAVGDAGIRFNGTEIQQGTKPLDVVTALMRREAWALFAAQGFAEADCDALSAAVNRYGLDRQADTRITAGHGEAIRRRVLDACSEEIGDVPAVEIERLIARGIAGGQRSFANRTDLALGYGILDGFDVPSEHIHHDVRPIETIEAVELFSDGYFKGGDGFGIASWEAAFREVESVDPHKIGAYMSTKGTTPTSWTDDRTYLGVAF
ncbi:MAG: PP2C family serine/threonine-protein phosphatase [Microvirga sp.]